MKKEYIQPTISVVSIEGVALLDNSPKVELNTNDVVEDDADGAWSKTHSTNMWTDEDGE